MDVLELDAASRTKVDEMRELLDGVRYAPVEARYKVYIIDEVHMLSTAAFNALLKTLEEPPPHAKFIFATTEIRKVPVTILSRCQRFDLRRVEPEVIAANLERIAAAEGARVEAEGLALIARAAEGSVRDAQSLLDQAHGPGRGRPDRSPPTSVRDMLGLADRAQTIELFETCCARRGRPRRSRPSAPSTASAPIRRRWCSTCWSTAHGAAVAKALGPDALACPRTRPRGWPRSARQVSAGTLSRRLADAAEGLRRGRAARPIPAAAVEMALIRLAYAADLPGPEEALKALRDGRAGRRRRRGPRRPPAAAAAAAGGGAAPRWRSQPAPARAGAGRCRSPSRTWSP